MPPTAPSPDDHRQSTADRATLRRQCIAARVALPAAEHAALSTLLEAHLLTWLENIEPTLLGFCWPIRAEFDARPLILRLLARGWRAALPMIVAVDAPMIFRGWTPDSDLAIGRHGIHYPARGEAVRPDLLLLPVNAFDARGFRIGYGGGYFDRTLAAMAPRPLAVGVGFELARLADIGPRPHDIPLDAVATEAGIAFFPR